jgi:hypothetical protein
MASAPGYRDYDGYPIFYLYRHSLELHLKAIVYRGAQLLGLISDEQIDTRSLLTRHELTRLLPTIQAIFKRMAWDGGVTDMLPDLLKLREIICLSRINNISGALPHGTGTSRSQGCDHGMTSALLSEK